MQQQVSDRGDELERVAGAKERADGNLKRSDSQLQQANTTIQVLSASSLHCHSDLLSIVPPESALCHLPLFSICRVSLLCPSLASMLQPQLSAAPFGQASTCALGQHLQPGCCDSKLAPNHPVCGFKSAGQDLPCGHSWLNCRPCTSPWMSTAAV